MAYTQDAHQGAELLPLGRVCSRACASFLWGTNPPAPTQAVLLREQPCVRSLRASSERALLCRQRVQLAQAL